MNINKMNKIRFELIDNRDCNYNESTIMEKYFPESEDGQSIEIETYFCYCKQFAASLGFCEDTINKWFGEL